MSAIILGIESSCDDTSAAVIEDGYLLSNVVLLSIGLSFLIACAKGT